jgi:spore germination cell wall hydrolase CwlJ-like protein
MPRLVDDDTLGTMLVWAEARGEPLNGQVAVAEVVLNRARLRYASDGSISDTIFRAKQFSALNDSTPWRCRIFEIDSKWHAVEQAHKAWLIAKGGSTLTGGAVLYHTIKAPAGAKAWPPGWASAPTIKASVEIGAHRFYVDRRFYVDDGVA